MSNKTGLDLSEKNLYKSTPSINAKNRFFIIPNSVFNKTNHNFSSSGLLKSYEFTDFYFKCAVQNYCQL